MFLSVAKLLPCLLAPVMDASTLERQVVQTARVQNPYGHLRRYGPLMWRQCISFLEGSTYLLVRSTRAPSYLTPLPSLSPLSGAQAHQIVLRAARRRASVSGPEGSFPHYVCLRHCHSAAIGRLAPPLH